MSNVVSELFKFFFYLLNDDYASVLILSALNSKPDNVLLSTFCYTFFIYTYITLTPTVPVAVMYHQYEISAHQIE